MPFGHPDKPPEEWTPEEWAALEQDLRILEDVDPVVKAARERLDAVIKRLVEEGKNK